MKRRDILKALAGLPVLGIFFQQYFEKQSVERARKQKLLTELDLDDSIHLQTVKSSPSNSQDLIRLGLIGYGARGKDLARALGFASPAWIKEQKVQPEQSFLNTTLQDWLSQANLNVAVKGICDVFEMRAKEGVIAAQNELRPGGDHRRMPETKIYKDYREMLNDKEIDAVIIATPDHWHAQMTIDASEAGKHIYCEKCMTRTEEEVYKVRSALEKSKVVFQLGHQYQQHVAFVKAKEIVNKDILGKITLIEATSNRNTPHGAWIRHVDNNGNPKAGNLNTIDWDRWLGSSPPVSFSIDRYYNWTKWWDYATGLSGQLMSHEYDTANQLLHLGIPSSCVASGGIYFYKDNREIPDIFHAVFEFDKKELTFIYSASLASDRSRGHVFMGHDASMELGNKLDLRIGKNSTQYRSKIENGLINPDKISFTFQPGMEGIDAITSATERYYADRGLIYTIRDGRRVDATYLHLKEWLDCIRNGGQTSVPIDRAVEVTLACHMATRSYREKKRVTWNPVIQRIV